MQNQKKRSPLFNKRSSSPSLHLGYRCRRYGSLYSRKEVVAKMVKQKKSMDGGSIDERADWKDPKELEAFCQFCAIQVMDGQRETGLGYDPVTGMFDAPDEWWNRKIAACPNAKTFKTNSLPNRELLNIMFGGTVATGNNAFCTSGPIPTETTKGSGDSVDDTEFVDPQCEPVVNVDAMEVEAIAQVKVILNMVLSLPGVYLGHYFHMFSTIYFMEKKRSRHMFEALSDNKDIQLKWLEKEYQRHPKYQ
nr:uncharacterized protein CFP56_41006 [Quercus suber]